MAKNTYETLLILDSNHYARDPGGVNKQVSDILTQAGGEVHVNPTLMGAKLAYPIDKHQKGTYWLAYYEIEGVKIPEIDRALQLAEPVIRHLTIKLEPRLVEPILANARGESIKMSTPAETSAVEEESVEEGGVAADV